MRVQLTLSTPTTRWNCMFTYSKGLTWNALKFSKIYLLIADQSFQIYCSVCIVFIVSICVSFLYICLTSETLHYPWIPSLPSVVVLVSCCSIQCCNRDYSKLELQPLIGMGKYFWRFQSEFWLLCNVYNVNIT